jgi:hypothetical protein
MEQYERLVLARAFASISALRRRPFLRRKAFARASYAAAWMYRDAGMPGAALLRIVRSLLIWPFPYSSVADVGMTFARLKLLLVTLRNLLLESPFTSRASRCSPK